MEDHSGVVTIFGVSIAADGDGLFIDTCLPDSVDQLSPIISQFDVSKEYLSDLSSAFNLFSTKVLELAEKHKLIAERVQ